MTQTPVASSPRRPGVLRLSALGGALFLAGCSVTPQPFTLDEALQAGQADRALLAAAQQPASQAIGLDEAIARALKYNRERRVQLLESVISRNQLQLSHFDMLPELAASAGYTQRSRLSASSSGTFENGTVVRTTPPTYSVSADKESSNQNLALTWNVLDFGLSYVRAGQQADRLLIAQERERKAAHNLIQDVRSAYWRAISAQRLLDKVAPLGKRVDTALANSRQVESLRLRNPLDALTYQRDLLDVRRSLEGLQKDLVDAKTSLATLMGLPAGAAFRLQDPGAAGYPVPEVRLDTETLERSALARRPELMESRYQNRISHAEGRAAMLGLLPGLRLNAGVHHDGSDYLLYNNWNDYGATLSFNLFNLFKAPAVGRQVDAEKLIAQERRLAVTAAVLGQVHVARQGYEQARQQFSTASDYLGVVTRIREQRRLMRAADRSGELELIREELTEMLSELRRDVAYADLQNSHGRIFVSAGLDPLPDRLEDDSLSGLAGALRTRFESWTSGEVGLVTRPLASQVQPWRGPGEHSFAFSADTFSLGGEIAYQARLADGGPLPAWLRFDAGTRTFSANPPAAAREIPIELIARNASGAKASDRFTLQLADVNDAPRPSAADSPELALNPQNGWRVTLPDNLFVDPDSAVLTYRLARRGFLADRDLPEWLQFDAATRTLSIPATSEATYAAARLALTLTASDADGLAASRSLTLQVLPQPRPAQAGSAAPVPSTQATQAVQAVQAAAAGKGAW